MTNPYNCLLKNTNFLIKTINDYVTSYIMKQSVYCCFGWYKLIFCMILRQFTISSENAFSNLLFLFLLLEKRVLGFVLLDKWNLNTSIEKVKVYFSILFFPFWIKFFNIKQRKLVATNVVIISNGAQLSGQRLALRKQKFLVRIQLLPMCKGELSAVIPWLMSKCL